MLVFCIVIRNNVSSRIIVLICNFRLNARNRLTLKRRLTTRKTVSKQRKFNYVNEDRIKELMEVNIKKTSESKLNWAVTAYIDWREDRLKNFQYDVGIYEADLLDLGSLTKENLNHALCYFIPEVTKVKGEGLYPGPTLYQLVVAIQKYLILNKLQWKLVDGIDFEESRTVLDNIMQERTCMNIGVKKRQAMVISYDTENELWERGILGEETPDKLRDTVLFLIGINVLLRAVDEHYNLRRDMPSEDSQIQFERNEQGEKYLVYREDAVTKTHNGGLRDMRRDRKIVYVYPSNDSNRCPVRLVEKYLNLCPLYNKKPNFYLKSLQKPTPKQWYAEQVVGSATLGKVVKMLMKEANIEGFFTNHSLRRTGGSRLFQAGVQRKLVKEVTGHTSDAVDQYQITSVEQRKALSHIIVNKSSNEVKEVESKIGHNDRNGINVEATSEEQCMCNCKKAKTSIDQSNIGDLISGIVKATNTKGKTVIKMSIEIINE